MSSDLELVKTFFRYEDTEAHKEKTNITDQERPNMSFRILEAEKITIDKIRFDATT